MRFYYLAASLAVAATTAAAFQQQPRVIGSSKTSNNALSGVSFSKATTTTLSAVTTQEEQETPCSGANTVIPDTVTGQSLRTAILTNANGELVNLGEQMGKGTSVGPLFVSIGDQEKLEAFLEKNPKIPRDSIFVDDYNFDAYKSAGFGRFDETDKEDAKEAMKNMVAPDLGVKGWLSYLGTAVKVSPVPKDAKFGEVPEGVLRLGGTFVVNGNDILYRWSDRVPGDHPDIDNVWSIAKEASTAKKNQGAGDLFANLFNF